MVLLLLGIFIVVTNGLYLLKTEYRFEEKSFNVGIGVLMIVTTFLPLRKKM
jgi:hypothetical protein